MNNKYFYFLQGLNTYILESVIKVSADLTLQN